MQHPASAAVFLPAAIESGCWIWQGPISKSTGYGTLTRRSAHRAVYELLVGPIPAGMHLDHTCHTADPTCPRGIRCPHRPCVNPDHLEPVTREENCRRCHALVTHCPRGHTYDEANTYMYGTNRKCRACNRVAAAIVYARKRERAQP